MSGLELLLLNLAAWSVQVAALGLAAAAAERLVPVERPAPRLALLQLLLAGALLLPLLQPWRPSAASIHWTTRLLSEPASTRAAASPAGAATPDLLAAMPVLVLAALAAGAAVQLARLALGLARLRSLRRRAVRLEAPPWLAALRDEIAPAARVAVSAEVAGPATFGLRSPVVLLPLPLRSLSEEHQRAVVLHELVHVRRGDWLAQVLEQALAALLFFHPAVRWLLGRVRLAREQCVDAEVVSRLGGKRAYLDSLVEVARFAAHARAVPAASFLTESHLRERVDLLLKEVSMSRLRTVAHVASTTAALVLAVSWAASAVPLQAKAKPSATVAIEDKADASELKLVQKVNPVYPPDAKSDKAEGVFRIDLVIGADGAIKEAKVAASAPTKERLNQIAPEVEKAGPNEGDKRLAEAALAAVKQWRYQPVVRNGKPVEVRATVTVAFKLQ